MLIAPTLVDPPIVVAIVWLVFNRLGCSGLLFGSTIKVPDGARASRTYCWILLGTIATTFTPGTGTAPATARPVASWTFMFTSLLDKSAPREDQQFRAPWDQPGLAGLIQFLHHEGLTVVSIHPAGGEL